MDAVRGIAGQREARFHEAARKMEFERIGPARAGGRCLSKMRAEAARDLCIEPSASSFIIAGAIDSFSVHTSDERLPVIGKIAKGPEGRKCS